MSKQTRSMEKGIQWEIAKGYLRSLVAIDGAMSDRETKQPFRYEEVSAAIEKFIAEFEVNGWHE